MNPSILIHAEKLLMKKALNKLSDKEQHELEELLRNYPEARDLQQTIADDFRSGRLATTHHLNNPQHTFPEMEGKIRQRKRILRLRQFAVAASVVILAGASLLFWNGQQSKPTSLISNNIDPTTNVVRLQLSNGQNILLNQPQAQIITSGQAIASANNTSMRLQANGHMTTSTTEWNILQVPNKLEYAITLADGSTVNLNAGTELKFPFSFSGKSREVFINGEAYFNIAKVADQPFIVHTPNGDIEVLGTAFNVNTYRKGSMKASLVHGSIAYTKGDKNVRLAPGKELIAEGDEYRIINFDRAVTLSWMNGVFFFHNTPLNEIGDMIHRWYDVPVIFDTPHLATQLFTGNLDKSKPLEAFLKLLKNTIDAKYYYSDGILHLAL